MPVSYNKRMVFIHIPKTAGTSIEQYFLEKKYIDDTASSLWVKTSRVPDIKKAFPSIKFPVYLRHLTWKQIKMIIGDEDWNTFFKFSIVRNPWDRLVSKYFHRVSSQDNSYSVNYIKRHEKSFEEFLVRKQYFLKSQSPFIMNESGGSEVDFIGRFEDLDETNRILRKRLNDADFQIKHYNKSEHLPYREYYTNETRDLAARLFRDDIENFGYDF